MTQLPDPKEVAHALILDNSVNDGGYRKIIRVDLLEQRIESALRARDEWWKRENEKLETSVNALRINCDNAERDYLAERENSVRLVEEREAAQAQQVEMVKALESISSCVCMASGTVECRCITCIARAVLAKIRNQ